VNRQAGETIWEGQFFALVSLAHAGFKFLLSCKSGCRASPLSLGATFGCRWRSSRAKSQLVFQRVEGTPRTKENGSPNSYKWHREVGGGEAV
jgi:hypothetical protein